MYQIVIIFDFRYSDLNEEDFKLHSVTFSWPSRIKPIIQLSRNRLSHKKDLATTELRERIRLFEQHVSKWYESAPPAALYWVLWVV